MDAEMDASTDADIAAGWNSPYSTKKII
jgi:hypothetical protein